MILRQELNNKLNVVVTKRYCLAFSYSTLIGILDKKEKTVIINNKQYGTTTGRHKRYFLKEYCNIDNLDKIKTSYKDIIGDKTINIESDYKTVNKIIYVEESKIADILDY